MTNDAFLLYCFKYEIGGIIKYMKKEPVSIDFSIIFIIISATSVIGSFIYFFNVKYYDIFVSVECEFGNCFESEENDFAFVKKSAQDVANCADETCLIDTSCIEEGSCILVACGTDDSKYFSGYSCSQ